MPLPSANPGTPSFPIRVAWLMLTTVVLYFCLFDGLGAIGLTGPDEPRYAAIAREMSQTGDWVTPRLYGKPWFEKPILYYWAAAVQYKLWGDSEIAARLPSAIAATLTTAALGWLAWRLYGWAAAQIVALLFPATVAAIGFGRAATTDMQFSAALALAMVAAVFIIRPARPPLDWEETAYAGVKAPPRQRAMGSWLWRCGFGAALGLATLAKGPAAVVLTGGSVGLWALATRRWKDALGLGHPLAIASFLVVALPWYVLCALRNPEFVEIFLISHNVQRFLTPVFQHEQPLWFFGPILLLAVLPWTLVLVTLMRDGLMFRGRRWVTSNSFFLACWVIFPIIFFSISKSKLPGYVLPAIPALALLLARSLASAGQRQDAAARWTAGSAGVALLVIGIVALIPGLAGSKNPAVDMAVLRPLAIIAILGGLLVMMLSRAGRILPAVITTALTVTLLVGAINRTLLPVLDSQVSPRLVAQNLIGIEGPRRESVSVYQVHRAWHYGLNYYLREELPVWSQEHDTRFIVTSEAGLRELQRQQIGLHVIDWVSPKAILAERQENLSLLEREWCGIIGPGEVARRLFREQQTRGGTL